ncbi:MAG: DUF2807 domain-containing protein [Crocinitomicaceae bacterium]|nr:DUF2807 domain-containing protein [Crocinitomicaceae bacterium]
MKQWLLFIPLIVLAACKKAEDRNCFKVAGKQTSLEIPLEAFHKLNVGAKLEVVLVQDSENKLVIHGRDNLINLVTYAIDDKGFLNLKNTNKCDFLRSYDKNKISVEVHFTHLDELFFEGTKNLTTTGTITSSDFKLTIQDGGATVYLNLDCQNIDATQGHGYGDFVLSGTCENANIKITSNGFGDTKGLTVTDNLVVVSSTPVVSSINAEGANTTVEINGSGNVIYVGNPLTLNYIQYGSGELINGN